MLNPIFWTFALVNIFSPFTIAVSSGKVGNCDVYGPWGCPNNNWKRGTDDNREEINRLKCLSNNGNKTYFMDWVTVPERSDNYTVRTGDTDPSQDPRSYVPGELMKIYIRVMEHDYKFRGLLIYAIDKNGIKVGDWEFPATEISPLFWVPPECPKSMLHTTAGIKPFLSVLNFRNPPVGTGDITFECLIKKGPANHGYFYHPMQKDLTLRENPSKVTQTWFKSKLGESCDQTCQQQGLPCDIKTMNLSSTGRGFEAAISRQYICKLPTRSSCSQLAPTSDKDGNCWYHSQDCPGWRNNNNPMAVSCSTKSASNSDGYRLCVCGDGTKDINNPSHPKNENNPDYVPLISEAPKFGHTTILPLQLLVGLVSWLFLGGKNSYFFVTAFIMFVFIGSCDAHNWMHTPGRAYTLASTIKPCLGRKSTDLHVQIKPDQPFAIEWATGHSRDSWFVVLHESDYEKMGDPNLINMLNEYLADDPKINEEVPAELERYHGTTPVPPDQVTPSVYNMGPNEMFQSKLNKNSTLFKQLRHPYAIHPGDRNNLNQDVYRYNKNYIASDRRASYQSTKSDLAWIDSVFKYKHLNHLARDWDGVMITVGGYKGPGHYIVHWRWSGYYDCMDVDVRQDFVDEIYGTITSGYLWNRVDHCQYINPMSIKTGCYQAIGSAEYCKQKLSTSAGRYGINVIPLHNPKGVYSKFKDLTNIPWAHSTCAQEDRSYSWTRLQGKVTESSVSFSQWKRDLEPGLCSEKIVLDTKKIEGVQTNIYEMERTLKQALIFCDTYVEGSDSCVGISWKKGAVISQGLHMFAFCISKATTSNNLWDSFFKVSPANYAISNGQTREFSFQPPQCENPNTKSRTSKCLNSEPAVLNNADFAIDIGDEFGRKVNHGVVDYYGWNCDRSTWMRTLDTQNPTVENTYMTSLYCKCFPNNGSFECDARAENFKHRTKWEVQVENGVFRVTTTHMKNKDTIRMKGCYVENVLLENPYHDSDYKSPQTLTTEVEVMDGRLTLEGLHRTGSFDCSLINSLKYQKIASQWSDAWLPGQRNPWWQIEFDTPQPIGFVQAIVPKWSNCSSWWAYIGGRCPSVPAVGWFDSDLANTGVIVGVTNSSCGSSTCDVAKIKQCGRLERANPSSMTSARETDLRIDCKGKIGKFVYLMLPGSNRRLAFRSIEVHRERPIGSQNDMVCYGVQARLQTATEPEYMVVLDPEDPIFYSTCFVREKNVTFLGGERQSPPEDWNFNGKCIDCQSYQRNKKLKGFDLNRWNVVDNCVDCHAEIPPVEQRKNWVLAYKDRQCHSSKNNCTEDDCIKTLDMKGRSSSETKSEQDCRDMVELDPECSNIATFVQRYERCYCYRNDKCCQHCTVGSKYTHYNVYEIGAEPMTTVASCKDVGVLSDDETMCCPKSCAPVMNKGESINPCGRAPRDCYNLPKAGGFCCKENLQKMCQDSGPPCKFS